MSSIYATGNNCDWSFAHFCYRCFIMGDTMELSCVLRWWLLWYESIKSKTFVVLSTWWCHEFTIWNEIIIFSAGFSNLEISTLWKFRNKTSLRFLHFRPVHSILVHGYIIYVCTLYVMSKNPIILFFGGQNVYLKFCVYIDLLLHALWK